MFDVMCELTRALAHRRAAASARPASNEES
jgi:hypothetical protein